MNRIVRAAGFAAAAVALVAGVSTSTPAIAVESRSPSAVAPAPLAAEAPAPAAQAPGPASVMTDPNLFQKMWSGVTSLITPRAETVIAPIPPQRSLADLVLAYAGVDTPDRQQECLANAVYFEARGEPIEGQLAVAKVVLNRAASGRYPADLCAVITQPWQFSFIHKGRFPKANRDSDAWRRAVAIARIAQDKLAATVPSNVLWYHATYVSPSWGKRLSRQSQIGLHVFYS